jgi:hypothetical protein
MGRRAGLEPGALETEAGGKAVQLVKRAVCRQVARGLTIAEVAFRARLGGLRIVHQVIDIDHVLLPQRLQRSQATHQQERPAASGGQPCSSVQPQTRQARRLAATVCTRPATRCCAWASASPAAAHSSGVKPSAARYCIKVSRFTSIAVSAPLTVSSAASGRAFARCATTTSAGAGAPPSALPSALTSPPRACVGGPGGPIHHPRRASWFLSLCRPPRPPAQSRHQPWRPSARVRSR